MNTNEIEEIYKSSNHKYHDLYNYFTNKCDIKLKTAKINVGIETYRTREYNNLEDVRMRKDVQYNSKSPDSFSRIGKPDQIWFYVSEDFDATVNERKPVWYQNYNPGDKIKIVISTWYVRKDIHVLIIPDFSGNNKLCQKLDLTPFKFNFIFWKYISKKFSLNTLQEENIYQLTSAFANFMIDRAQEDRLNIDGLFYPSVQYPSQSNLALHKSVVDDEKIILKSLSSTEFYKSITLDITGAPKYRQICDFKKGFYDPGKDHIDWRI